jgi:hypothetical protein
MTPNKKVSTECIEIDDNFIRHINDNTSIAMFANCYVDHNLDDISSELIIKDLEIGSWILRNYKDSDNGIIMNAITIKLKDGIVHHNGFKFILKEEPQVYIKRSLSRIDTFKTMHEFLNKLNVIYGLDLNKQVIYEDD